MKKLIFLLISMLAFVAVEAQSATVTLSASAIISGGDGTGKIASAVWSVQGTPPAPVTIVNQGMVGDSAKATATFTKAGTYYLVLTAKDNLNNVATGTVEGDIFNKQTIIISVVNSKIKAVVQ